MNFWRNIAFLLAALLACGVLSGCAIVPAETVHQACLSLSEAWTDAKMGDAWYERTEKVLARCGGADHR